jgi:hypothetical protein
VIPARREPLNLGDQFLSGLLDEPVEELWEPWMRHADQALDDQRLLETLQTEWNRHCKKSQTRGRLGTPAEVVLRLLLLKHIRDWSFEELEREARANLVYRQFIRIGGAKVPDHKSISRYGRQLGPEMIQKLHQRAGQGYCAGTQNCGWTPPSMLRHCAIPRYLSENIADPRYSDFAEPLTRFLILAASLRTASESRASIGICQGAQSTT